MSKFLLPFLSICHYISMHYTIMLILNISLGLDSMSDDKISVLVSRPFYQGLGLILETWYQGLDLILKT